MVFVRKSPGRSGSTKVQLAERRAGRDVVVEHIGTARGEAELAVLMAEARRRLRPGQDAFDLDIGGLDEAAGSPGRAGVITGKRSAVLWRVLSSAYDRLGFDALGDEAFRQLVLARIIEPTSKADSLRVLEEIGVQHASLRTMFRSLQRCQKRGYRDVIAGACFTHAAASGDVSLCLYDVTTLYFEAENEDALRKVGYSKERRVDPQIVVGAAGGPGRVSAGDRLLGRQHGRDHHDHPDGQEVPGAPQPGGHGGRRRRRHALGRQPQGAR